MRVVISGGSGLMGRRLVDDLLPDGHEIVVLSRSPEKYRSQLPSAVSIVGWDGRTVDSWAESLDGADAVVNLAGANLAGDRFLPDRWTEDKKRLIKDSRLDAGQALVKAVEVAEDKPKLLIQASAVGYYGPRGNELITESSPPGDDFLARLCVEWEASTAPVESMGLRRIILRTGLTLSTEGGPLPRLLTQFKLFGGGHFGSGRQWWPWIHIDDVTRATRFLMEDSSAAGAFNITAPNPLTNRDFGKALGRALNRPALLPVPAFAMRLLVGEVATVVLDGQRAIPKKLEELGFTFRFNDLEEALLDLLNQ